jgi:PAS domain S-box-containing protein
LDAQALQCLVAFGAAVVVGIYAASRGDRVYWSVVSLMAAIALWTAGTAVRIVSAPETGFGLFAVYYLGAVSIAPLWANLAARLTHASWLTPRRALLLGVPSAFAYLAAITNPLHHLYFQPDYPQVEVGLSATAGPLLWPFTVWSYLLVAAGMSLFVRYAWGVARSGQRLRGVLIASAAILPMFAGIMRSAELIAADSNATRLAIAVSVIALFTLHWRYRMRDALPLAMRDVIGHLGDGVIILDHTGVILDANSSADDIFGAKTGTMRGRTLIEVAAGSDTNIDPARMELGVCDLEQSDAPWVREFETLDGRFIEATTAKVCGGDGESTGFYSVLRDHTERRRMERFLRQSQRMETMAGLSAGIAHEINNPLAYIRSNLNHIGELAQELEDRYDESGAKKPDECEELRSVAQECSEGIDRIGGIIDRMRRFSRMRADEFSAVDINEALSDALKMARLRGDASIKLKYQPDASLPPIRASHGHIVQLLLNLCSNARQAVEGVEGIEDPSVEISTQVSENEISIRIRDNGSGIPSRIRGRIFDPFFTTKAPGEGTGLGLPIAYGIAREHGGSLEFEPAPSGGAQFTLRLPFDGQPGHNVSAAHRQPPRRRSGNTPAP